MAAKWLCSAVEFAEMAGAGASRGAMPYHLGRRIPHQPAGAIMGKEQRASKNTKKPKKDAPTPKAAGTDRPVPPVTSVAPKGKLAKKPL
jgi:hypothetical protein